MATTGISHRARHAEGARARPGIAATAAIAVVACALSTLVLVRVDGKLPGAELDLSWPYTLADAAARRLAFGRDVVFTFGPLSSLYTDFFLPGQRTAVVALKAVLIGAFCLSAVAVSRRRVLPAALALPLLLANLNLPDAFFLVAPWTIVPLAAAPWRHRRLHVAALAALAAVIGPLVLVKGTLAVPVATSLAAAAAAAALRRRWPAAAAVPVAAAVSAALLWVGAGQRLADLPWYVRREGYVAAGYTDAMSLAGDAAEVWTFLACAAVLLLAQVFPRRAPALPTLAAAAILFVAFKAGFVRHDGHATIAASALALLGFLLFLVRGDVASGVGLAAGLAGWVLIAGPYMRVDPASDWDRLTAGLRGGSQALAATATDPGGFRRAFDAGRARIAAAADLAPTAGPVDLYPDSQALLLASGRDYRPRPVIQSYSAYTPELAFLNAAHLDGPRAPRTVFFDVGPIDGRHPALEDGPSWPALLGQYRFRTMSQGYAVLDRDDGAPAAALDPLGAAQPHAFGEPVAVPDGAAFVWARMRFHPTPLGRLASALFKRPILRIAVTDADGRVEEYRLIAGMAEAGFLLSPTVSTARDFVALRSTAPDALAARRVRSFAVRQEGGGFWGTHYDVAFSALRVLPDPAVDDVALGHLEAGPPVEGLPAGGECTVDTVDGHPVDGGTVIASGPTATVTGWAFLSPASGDAGGRLRVGLTPDGGPSVYAEAERFARTDVDAYFHLSRPTRAGFSARVNLSAVAGSAALRVVQDGPAGLAACGPTIVIQR